MCSELKINIILTQALTARLFTGSTPAVASLTEVNFGAASARVRVHAVTATNAARN